MVYTIFLGSIKSYEGVESKIGGAVSKFVHHHQQSRHKGRITPYAVRFVIFSIWWQGKDKHRLKDLNNYISERKNKAIKRRINCTKL